jgi:hypothetical protein
VPRSQATRLNPRPTAEVRPVRGPVLPVSRHHHACAEADDDGGVHLRPVLPVGLTAVPPAELAVAALAAHSFDAVATAASG